MMADNPSLTIRLDGGEERCAQRLVFSPSLSIFESAAKCKIFSDSFKEKSRVVCCADAGVNRISRLENAGVSLLVLNAKTGADAEFWDELKTRLYGEERISSLYVEGGARVLSSILRAKAADYAFVYESPEKLGSGLGASDADLKNSWKISDAEIEKLGADTLKRGKIVYL